MCTGWRGNVRQMRAETQTRSRLAGWMRGSRKKCRRSMKPSQHSCGDVVLFMKVDLQAAHGHGTYCKFNGLYSYSPRLGRNGALCIDRGTYFTGA